ncbi:MAG TPA: STAS domain-containing protein [Jatrophihabitantaceae bacterium]
MDLSLESKTVAGWTVLAVGGEIDTYTAPTLRDRMTDLLDSGTDTVIVDLSGVDFLDSTGLGVLVAGLERAKQLGGALPLVCAQERILRLFRITGLDAVFTICPSVDAAVEVVTPHSG